MKKIQMTAKQAPTLQECIRDFERRCIANNLSEQSIATYNVHCGLFAVFAGAEDTPITELPQNVTEGFIAHLKQERRCSDATVLSYMRTIRVFLYYCMEMEYVAPYKIKLPKAEKKIKETYTDAELAALLKKPDIKKCGFTEYRIWVYSTYLLATGNRISTALNIRLCDLDFDNGLIQLNTMKNRKAQIIPMSDTLRQILREYLSYRQGASDDYLFCNACGGQADKRTYQEGLAAYNRARGVKKTSAHLYRHTFAKKWIMNGGDVFRLQKLLGHSDLTITREYVNMFSVDLSQNYSQFNPLDTMKINSGAERIRMAG